MSSSLGSWSSETGRLKLLCLSCCFCNLSSLLCEIGGFILIGMGLQSRECSGVRDKAQVSERDMGPRLISMFWNATFFFG